MTAAYLRSGMCSVMSSHLKVKALVSCPMLTATASAASAHPRTSQPGLVGSSANKLSGVVTMALPLARSLNPKTPELLKKAPLVLSCVPSSQKLACPHGQCVCACTGGVRCGAMRRLGKGGVERCARSKRALTPPSPGCQLLPLLPIPQSGASGGGPTRAPSNCCAREVSPHRQARFVAVGWVHKGPVGRLELNPYQEDGVQPKLVHRGPGNRASPGTGTIVT